MKISVAITTYNGEQYLAEQLESIKNQTRAPDEVIISDDCSTDTGPTLAKNFIEQNKLDNWQLIKNAENLGAVENFKKALSLCTGDIIFLCDQDDVWRNDKIAVMTEIMNSQSNVLSLASGYDIMNRFGEKSDIKFRPMYSKSCRMRIGELRKIKGKLLEGNIAQGCCCAYRKSVVKEYLEKGKENTLPHDWALNLLAFERNGIYYVNRPLVSYRIHDTNASGAISDNESVYNRVEILSELSENTRKASELVPEKAQQYLRLALFIEHRTKVSETGSIRLFAEGLIRYPDFVFSNHLAKYFKDLYAGIKTGTK